MIEETLTPGTLNSGEKLDYAFGLSVGQYRGLKTVGHGGAWMGYRSETFRFPEQRFSVICLSNSSSTNPTRLVKQIADLYLAGEFTEESQKSAPGEAQLVEIPSSELEGKTGTYLCTKTGIMMELLIKEGKLTVEALGMSFRIAPIKSNHFIAVDTPFDIDFEFEKPGSSESLQISVRVEDEKPDIYQRLNVVPLDSDEIKDFAGEYHCEELDTTYKIMVEESKLLLSRRNFAQEILKPTSKDLLKGADTAFQFFRDDHDRVAGFNLGAGRVKNIRFVK